jgi:hypothetical protein
VNWFASRIAVAPTIPEPESLDSNNVLVYNKISPCADVPMPDGQTPVKVITGIYVYAVKEAAEADYVAGRLPYYDQTSTDTILNPDILNTTLIDATGGLPFLPDD